MFSETIVTIATIIMLQQLLDSVEILVPQTPAIVYTSRSIQYLH